MISVILPSCHRPKQLRNMLESLRKTTVGYDVEVIALIDDDLESASIAENYDCYVDYSEKRRKVLSLWNDGLLLSSGNLIHPAMDDLIYHESWLQYGLESHAVALESCGVVGFNDLAYDGNTQVATQFMFDREYCKKYMGGVIAPPVYEYYRLDSEWNEKAKMLGKFFWEKRSIVEHCHSAHNKRTIDEHDLYRMENNFMEIDRITYEDRLSRGFPVEWDSVI